MTTERLPFIIKLPLSLVSITIIIYWLDLLQPILVPFLISIILSILLYPVCVWVEKKISSRIWGITITLILFTCLIGMILYLASTQISDFPDMFPQLQAKLEQAYNNLQLWLFNHFNVPLNKQRFQFEKYRDQLIDDGGNVVGTALTATSNVLGNLSIMPVYMFFLLLYRDFFKDFFYKAFYSVENAKVDEVLCKIYDVIHNYLTGVVIVTLIVGTLNTLSLVLLGIDYPVFFGFFAAVLLIIPYIGILIGSLLPIIIALVTKDSPMYAVGVAASFFIVQMLEGNFITPNIVGSKISINPLAAIVGLLMGASLWGLAGMALSLPIIAIGKVIFDSIPSLQPYGFLIGETESYTQEIEKKRTRANKIEKEIVGKITGTTHEVKSFFRKKKVAKKPESKN